MFLNKGLENYDLSIKLWQKPIEYSEDMVPLTGTKDLKELMWRFRNAKREAELNAYRRVKSEFPSTLSLTEKYLLKKAEKVYSKMNIGKFEIGKKGSMETKVPSSKGEKYLEGDPTKTKDLTKYSQPNINQPKIYSPSTPREEGEKKSETLKESFSADSEEEKGEGEGGEKGEGKGEEEEEKERSMEEIEAENFLKEFEEMKDYENKKPVLYDILVRMLVEAKERKQNLNSDDIKNLKDKIIKTTNNALRLKIKQNRDGYLNRSIPLTIRYYIDKRIGERVMSL